ncbi:hypothetical protein JJL45_00735 [Tamlana sp. s12]|uniref:hypothetical protein n=1 Tax=Flavobacteriaceae TaxID=49546 RepID=UPI0007FBB46F|nr:MULTISPECIES: hypothetical protein [Tamlana]OBQ57257.1 hypothetical protein VQ01_01930 [Tamlana sp. s12]QQY82553.1 hypothetical protein JJL45_00735 [Tamlana sp. s12]
MKSLYFILFFTVLLACSSDNNNDNNCNYLLDINVNYSVDLTLPQYSTLNSPGNSIYIPNVGNRGIILANTGANILAWDASDPNHAPSECSAIIPDGLFGTCGCGDDNRYNFITGEADNNDALTCALKFYPANRSGNILYISN